MCKLAKKIYHAVVVVVVVCCLGATVVTASSFADRHVLTLHRLLSSW